MSRRSAARSRRGRRSRQDARVDGAARRGGPSPLRILRHPAWWAAIAAILLYLPSLPNGFVWDDHSLFESNLLLRSIGGVAKLLVSDFWFNDHTASGLWRPWITLSYAVDGALSHWNPAWFRLMNILAHAGVSALLVLLVLQAARRGGARDRSGTDGHGWLGWSAAAAGLWFAAMPAHAESVVWISGRTDVYCALFFLLALWLDRRARRTDRGDPGWAPVACLALALLSKEAALAFLPLVAALEWAEPRRPRGSWRSSLRWVAAYGVVTALYLAAHLVVTHSPVTPKLAAEASVGQVRAASWLLLPAYLQFLWPWFPHSPAASIRIPASPLAPAVLAGAAFSVAFLGLVLWALWRRHRVATPLVMLVLTLLPTVVVNLMHGYMIFGERYFYLSSVAAAWLLGIGLGALSAAGAVRWAGPALAVALAGASAVETWHIIPAWESDNTLFRFMTVRQPDNYMAHVQWARRLLDLGRLDEAERQLATADSLDPARPDVPAVRALLDTRRGRWNEALASADRALAIKPDLTEPRVARVVALLSLGRLDEARRDLEAMRRDRAPNPRIEALWGQYLVAAKRPQEAMTALERAGRLFPQDVDVAYASGLAASAAGRLPEALAAFRRTVTLQPAHYDAWLQIALTSHLLGDGEGARRALARAAALPAAADGRAARLARLIAAASGAGGDATSPRP